MTRPEITNHLTWLYWLTGALASVIVLVNLLAALALHYPYLRYDDWNLYADYLELGTSGFLLSQYFGHALTLPKLVFLGNFALFPGTSVPTLIVSISLKTLTALVLVFMLWRFRGTQASTAASVAACALIVGMVFWMCTHLELTWPLMVGNPFVIAFAAIAAWALCRHLQTTTVAAPGLFDRWLGLAAMAGVLGVFSFGAGIAIWPGVATVMVLYRVSWPRIAFFLSLGLAAIVLHSLMPSQRISLEFSQILELIPSPGQALNFFFTFLGTAINFSLFPFDGTRTGMPRLTAAAGFGGLLILAIYSWRLFRAPRAPHPVLAIPLVLTWFAVFAAMLSTIGRAGSEMFGNPNDYRYAGWSAAFWTGLLWLALYHLLRNHGRTSASYILAGIATVVLTVFLLASVRGIDHLLEQQPRHHLGALAMTIAPEERRRDIRSLTFFAPDQALSLRQTMIDNRHNIFFEDWTVRLGSPLNEYYQVDPRAACRGRWLEQEAHRQQQSRVYKGWATGPRGDFRTVLLVANGVIIGGGRPAWPGDIREPGNRQPAYLHPWLYFPAMLFGHTPAWLAMADLTDLDENVRINVFGVLRDNTVCQIKPPQ